MEAVDYLEDLNEGCSRSFELITDSPNLYIDQFNGTVFLINEPVKNEYIYNVVV